MQVGLTWLHFTLNSSMCVPRGGRRQLQVVWEEAAGCTFTGCTSDNLEKIGGGVQALYTALLNTIFSWLAFSHTRVL